MHAARCMMICIYRLSSVFNIDIILEQLGAIIQSTLDEEQTTTHAKALSDLTSKAGRIVVMLSEDDDELTFLRIRSKHREIMVSKYRLI